MRNFLLTLVVMALTALNGVLNAQIVIVQDASGNNAKQYTDLQEAVNGAKSGDYLYLSGGIYDLTNYFWTGYDEKGRHTGMLVVDKPLHFVGAGYRGADIPHIQKGRFAFRKSASGSTITGLMIENLDLDSVSNTNVSRCKITNHFALCGRGVNDVITECEINTLVGRVTLVNTYAAAAYYDCLISKNIIFGDIIGSNGKPNNVTLTNNVIRGAVGVQNAIVKNNILCYVNNFDATYSEVMNNLVVGYFPANDFTTYSNNLEGYTTADIFVDYGKGDYHLKGPGKTTATDGKEVGIYGTDYPFKDNRLPAIPYFSKRSVSSETDVNSKLKIDVTIEAQER